MTRRFRPRVVVAAGVLAAAVALIAGRRPWIRGTTSHDAVLGTTTVVGTGTQSVPGLVALALVLAAAVLAAATSGRLLRRLTLLLAVLAALALAGLSIRAATSAAGILGSLAATASGRDATVPIAATASTAWPWLVAASAVVAALAGAGGLAAAGTWRGLSERYDAPDTDVAGGRGQRVLGAWDQLDHGVDPTQPGAPPRPEAGSS